MNVKTQKSELEQMMMEGIQYAIQRLPTQLPFLEHAMMPFVNKMLSNDAGRLVQFIRQSIPADERGDDGDWLSLDAFETALTRVYEGIKAPTPRTPRTPSATLAKALKSSRKSTRKLEMERVSDQESVASEEEEVMPVSRRASAARSRTKASPPQPTEEPEDIESSEAEDTQEFMRPGKPVPQPSTPRASAGKAKRQRVFDDEEITDSLSSAARYGFMCILVLITDSTPISSSARKATPLSKTTKKTAKSNKTAPKERRKRSPEPAVQAGTWQQAPRRRRL